MVRLVMLAVRVIVVGVRCMCLWRRHVLRVIRVLRMLRMWRRRHGMPLRVIPAVVVVR